MTRPLTAAEIEECARAGYDANPVGEFDRTDIEDAESVLAGYDVRDDDGDDGGFAAAVIAKAAEIRARDEAVTVRGRVDRDNAWTYVLVDEIEAIQVRTAAFPNLPDGATVEVTVRVVQETK